MFQVVAWHWELIFSLLTSPKCVSRARMAIWTHFRPPDHPKMRLGWGREAMFQGLACHFELIFGLLNISQYNLGEVEKAMFQGLDWHSQLIFGLWTSRKCNLMNSKKRWFKLFEVIFCFLTNQNFYFFKSIKRRFKWSNGTYKTFSISCQADVGTHKPISGPF